MAQAQCTQAMKVKAEQLAEQAHTWQTGRSKQDGSGFFLIPSSDDPEHIAHRSNRFGCTCDGHRNRGVCSHMLACQIIDRRAWGARITAAPVLTTKAAPPTDRSSDDGDPRSVSWLPPYDQTLGDLRRRGACWLASGVFLRRQALLLRPKTHPPRSLEADSEWIRPPHTTTREGEQDMATALGTTRIAERSLGPRTVMNTNFGRIAFVERHEFGGRPYWSVGIVCNGISDYSRTFKTRHDALADFESL